MSFLAPLKNTIDLSRADKIEGWCSPLELAWLARWAQSKKVIVEIGSHVGRTTCVLAEHTPGFVLAVDHWEGEYNGTTDRRQKFEENLADLISIGKVVMLAIDSKNLSRGACHPAPDMVFIDGDHHKEFVASDIRWALENCEPGALICGHDADLEEVQQALNECLPGWTRGAGVLWFRAK